MSQSISGFGLSQTEPLEWSGVFFRGAETLFWCDLWKRKNEMVISARPDSLRAPKQTCGEIKVFSVKQNQEEAGRERRRTHWKVSHEPLEDKY